MKKRTQSIGRAVPLLAAVLLFSSCGRDGKRPAEVNPVPNSAPAPATNIPEPVPAPAPEPATPPPRPEINRDHAPALPPTPVGLVFHGDRSQPRAAITFDACQTEKPAWFDEEIWKVLVDREVKATIFLGGRWMEAHPEETRMIGQNPLIEIGNHSYIHPDFTRVSEERIREELEATQDIMWRKLGRQGVTFRFPYGYYDERSLAVVAELGLYPIQWDVVSGDPSKKVTARAMTKRVLAETQNGSIIIFHINGRGWNTGEALPAIVDGLRSRGFELVTVSELMGYEHPPQTSIPAWERALLDDRSETSAR